MRILFLIALALLLSGCSPFTDMTENLAIYGSSVTLPSGETITGQNKHGARLVLKLPDGTEFELDDRGHPTEQGTLGKLVDFATVQAASKVGAE